ncbi:hypothetical protein JCM8097_008633 [Rhodosporidiobolus ruineniae]
MIAGSPTLSTSSTLVEPHEQKSDPPFAPTELDTVLRELLKGALEVAPRCDPLRAFRLFSGLTDDDDAEKVLATLSSYYPLGTGERKVEGGKGASSEWRKGLKEVDGAELVPFSFNMTPSIVSDLPLYTRPEAKVHESGPPFLDHTGTANSPSMAPSLTFVTGSEASGRAETVAPPPPSTSAAEKETARGMEMGQDDRAG